MHCNLRSRPADDRPTSVLFRFNYDAMKFEVAELIHCRIIAFLTLTFDHVNFTFDL